MASLGFKFSAHDARAVPEGFIGLPDLPALTELQRRRQWVSWRQVMRDGKWTKPPVDPHTGRGASHSNPDTWGSYDDALRRTQDGNLAGVGYVLSEDDGLTGFDLDACRDAETGAITDPDIRAIIDLRETYAEISPSGTGVRLIARGKVDKTVKCDPAHVEIYRSLRYLTITGQHFPGTPIEIREAPQTLAALLARVEQFRPADPAPAQASPEAAAPRPSPGDGGSPFFRNVNDAAMRDLGVWVSALFPQARLQPATGAYRVSSRSLGRALQEDLSIAPNGIVDFGVHDMGDGRQGKRTPIDLALEHGRHADARAAAFWLCDQLGRSPAHLGWEDNDALSARGEEIARTLLQNADGSLYDADTGEIVEPAPAPPEPAGRDLPNEDLQVPGLVGEIADWVCLTNTRPSRLFGIAAGLMTVGALAGRRFYTGKPRSGTNLYMMIIADSGWGKERPQQAIRRILGEAGGGALNAGSMSSSAALSVRLTERPSMIQIIDEIHRLFRQANARGSSNQELNLVQDLCTLWGRSDDEFIPQSTTTRGDVTIKRPTLSIFGATVPEQFYKQLRSEMVSNGFLNRFLVLPIYKRPARNRDVPEDASVPVSIAKAAAAILNWPPSGGDMPVIHTNNPQQPPRDVTIPMSKQAEQDYYAFEEAIDDYLDAHPGTPGAEVKKRLPDMAKRIALIVAIGRQVDDLGRARVERDDLAFARRFTEWSADELIRGIEENFAENENQANMKMVLGHIRKAGSISRKELYRKVGGRLDARSLSSVIQLLQDAAHIEVDGLGTTPKGGRPAIIYRHLREN